MPNHLTVFSLIALFAVVPFVGGCSSPTDDAPAATVEDAIETPPETDTTSAAPAETTNDTAGQPTQTVSADMTHYEFTDNTYIGFAGSKSAAGVSLGTHYGQFLGFDGGVSAAGAGLEQAKIQLSIDMTEMDTDDSRLTGTLKGEKFFQVDEHPTATFVSTSITPRGDAYEVKGNLTIIGVTKGVTFPAEISVDGDTLTARSEFSLDRTEWGIGVGHVMNDGIIDKKVLMELDVEAEKMDAPADGGDPFSQSREGSRPKDGESDEQEAA